MIPSLLFCNSLFLLHFTAARVELQTLFYPLSLLLSAPVPIVVTSLLLFLQPASTIELEKIFPPSRSLPLSSLRFHSFFFSLGSLSPPLSSPTAHQRSTVPVCYSFRPPGIHISRPRPLIPSESRAPHLADSLPRKTFPSSFYTSHRKLSKNVPSSHTCLIPIRFLASLYPQHSSLLLRFWLEQWRFPNRYRSQFLSFFAIFTSLLFLLSDYSRVVSSGDTRSNSVFFL